MTEHLYNEPLSVLIGATLGSLPLLAFFATLYWRPWRR